MENSKSEVSQQLIALAIYKIWLVHGKAFKPGFKAWLEANWPIYLRFESEALKVARSGRKHYSARTIVEFLRHQTALTEKDGQFKINDHATPDLARLFVIRNNVHGSLFEFRGNALRGGVV